MYFLRYLGMPFLLLLPAYLLGAIPTAVWVSRACFPADIRTLGSKNAGSTNMYRVYGFKAGAPVQLVDIAKGAVAAMLPVWAVQVGWVTINPDHLIGWQLLCGIAAVIGHVYTVFAGFKGGKGVNAMLGMMLAIEPLGCLVGVIAFVLTLLSSKMVSLSSMLAVAAFALYIAVRWVWWPGPELNYLTPTAALLLVGVVYTHRANIQRIRQGTESKVGFLSKK